MDDNRKPRKNGGANMCVLLLLPFLYVASAGPALAMVTHRTMFEETYLRIYAPVETVACVSGPSKQLLRAYQRSCGSRILDISYVETGNTGDGNILINYYYP